jgi:hypothetical protein
MFSYRCRRCGVRAYSSANASTVGHCPRCAGALAPAADGGLTPFEARVRRERISRGEDNLRRAVAAQARSAERSRST